MIEAKVYPEEVKIKIKRDSRENENDPPPVFSEGADEADEDVPLSIDDVAEGEDNKPDLEIRYCEKCQKDCPVKPTEVPTKKAFIM